MIINKNILKRAAIITGAGKAFSAGIIIINIVIIIIIIVIVIKGRVYYIIIYILY